MEHVPKESETIAARRAVRTAEKLKIAREKIKTVRAWWNNGLFEGLILFFFFALNLYLILPYFGTSSIEYPFSGPVVPLIGKVIAFVGRIPLLYAIQIVNIIFFALFPLSLYFFVKRITDRKMAAVITVLISSLPYYFFAEDRVRAMFLGIDAAHIASLSVIPFAVYALMNFMREGKVINCLKAAALAALIALISPFGFMNYIIFSIIVVFSELLLGQGRLKVFRLVLVLAITGGLCSFWYNPIFFSWMIAGPMGEDIRLMLSKLIPISFFAIPVLAIFGYLLFDRKPELQPLFLAAFYTIAFAAITLAGGGLVPSNPSRYLPELSISVSLLVGIIYLNISEYLKKIKIPEHIPAIAQRHFTNTLTGILIFGILLGILVGRNRLNYQDEEVLGLWTSIEKGEIWVARDRFTATGNFIGGFITLSTISGLTVVEIKTRKLNKNKINPSITTEN